MILDKVTDQTRTYDPSRENRICLKATGTGLINPGQIRNQFTTNLLYTAPEINTYYFIRSQRGLTGKY